MKKILIIYIIVISGIFHACDYLDVVPDNIATLDNAFSNRTMAEKYLFTCYSYMPRHGNWQEMAFFIGDEYWKLPDEQSDPARQINAFTMIAKGNQSANNPALNYWDGLQNGRPMFTALRDCNTFLERIEGNIPRLDDSEKKRWVAEVKCLKAYYHYWLLRMYGPIPLIKENLPISASIEEVQVKRDPVDECFDYIVSLLDEAVADLPLRPNETMEWGRFTQPIALALKAKVLVEAASPLFNGNTDYADFKRQGDNVQYFNQTYDVSKWEKAALACRNAIDTCHLANFELFHFSPGIAEVTNPEIITQMSIRNSVCESDPFINREVVWSDPNSTTNSLAENSWPTVETRVTGGANDMFSIPLNIVEMFYTSNGVPIDEDREWEESGNYNDRYSVKKATEDDKYNISVGYETLALNLNRETRFYANLTFDGNLWYGYGKYDCENQWVIMSKNGQTNGIYFGFRQNVTGYSAKKFNHYRNSYSGTDYTIIGSPFPVIRLADLYLLYSEALNEAYGPSQEAYKWIDLVRERAGLEGVKTSWAKYAKSAYQNKPTTQDGFREIIRRERLIELANEGQRYWEIRRWKKGIETWNNQQIEGLDPTQSETEMYYRVRILFRRQFARKDYLWPIRDRSILTNPNLDQNPGW